MTVVGIGIDLVDRAGFAAQLSDVASDFAGATFAASERRAVAQAPVTTPEATRLAARFAAKEAFIKAWSVARFGRAPALHVVDPREIVVVSDDFGRPRLELRGAVADAVAELAAETGAITIHLSLTHDGPTAGAVVVLDAEEVGPMA